MIKTAPCPYLINPYIYINPIAQPWDFLRHGDFMYVFGGYDGSAWLNDMFDFDFERGAWLGSKPEILPKKQMTIFAGWWFGTFLFFHMLGIIIPAD